MLLEPQIHFTLIIRPSVHHMGGSVKNGWS